MMTLWSMMRSPLMIGGEMTKNDDFTLTLLTNGDVLAIGKESFCGHPLTTTEEESVWLAPRQDGKGLYCALFNLSDEARTVRVSPGQLGYPAVCARELWTGREESAAEGITATLPAHDAAVYLLTF